jgi:cyclomaltodextrinase / maltogenic alpha-amylase / neopullulanase
MPAQRQGWSGPVLVGLLLVLLAVPGLLFASGIVDPSPSGAHRWETAESRSWPADAVLYHVFVDRFADGDEANTQVPGIPGDPGYAAALTDWMGGDLAGLEARLDHVVATGANTLWLSPVNQGPAYHGYHPTDLLDVDPRFGSVEELRRLIDSAQEQGVRVVYDLVLNHTSDQHPWFVEAQSDCDGSPFVDWYRFTECPGGYASFAGLPELPQLDLDHAPVREYVFEEVLPFYLDDLGVDGFRLDHVQGPSRDFWRAFDAELGRRWPETLVIGEVWAPLTTIDSYGDVLDAATAFPLRERLLATFASGGDVRAVAMPVAATLDEQGLPDASRPRQQSYLSSHDQSRFGHEADDDTRRIALAYAAILTMPGLPTIYYGDEVGRSQTDALPPDADFADRWFREPMPWDPAIWPIWDDDLLARVASFARARTTTPALHSGRYVEVVGAGDIWVFERDDGADRLLVALNNGEVTADLRDLLVDAGWPDLALLDDVEVVIAPGSPSADDDGAARAADGPRAASDPLRIPGVDALVLRLPAP